MVTSWPKNLPHPSKYKYLFQVLDASSYKYQVFVARILITEYMTGVFTADKLIAEYPAGVFEADKVRAEKAGRVTREQMVFTCICSGCEKCWGIKN